MRKLPLVLLIAALMPTLLNCVSGSPRLPPADSAGTPMNPDEVTHQITGAWGGEGATLVGAEGRTIIEFPCGEGKVDHLIPLDSSGQFNEEGTLENGQGTVLRDEVGAQQGSSSEKVRFTGRVSGDLLTISIQYGDRKTRAIEYTLTRGARGHVPLCQ